MSGNIARDELLPGDERRECIECSLSFVFTAGERAFFSDMGYLPPRRCPDCRRARRLIDQAPRSNDRQSLKM